MESLKLGEAFRMLEAPKPAPVRMTKDEAAEGLSELFPPLETTVTYPSRYELFETASGFQIRNARREWRLLPTSVGKEVAGWCAPYEKNRSITFRCWPGKADRIFAVADYNRRLYAKVLIAGKNKTIRIGGISVTTRDEIRKVWKED